MVVKHLSIINSYLKLEKEVEELLEIELDILICNIDNFVSNLIFRDHLISFKELRSVNCNSFNKIETSFIKNIKTLNY